MLYLPENLKKYRILKNLTQEDVAEYLRITPQSVSTWRVISGYNVIACIGKHF
jgi:predicted transcriptional regulator